LRQPLEAFNIIELNIHRGCCRYSQHDKRPTVRGVIKLIKFTKLDFSNTLKIANKEGLTFYDASYIAVAESLEAILVTEDEKLKKIANKFIKTMTYSDLEEKLAQD
jgi:predicted nucleic acid-binding protein